MRTKFNSHECKTILATAELNKKFGCIDTKGNEVIPIKYDDIGSWGNNLIPVNLGAREVDYQRKGGKWGYCDHKGTLSIPLQFAQARTFSEGIAAVLLNKKWGFIDTSGKIIVSPTFDEVRLFKEGLCAVSKNGKWGYVNQQGEEVIKLKYAGAGEFSGNLARIFKKENCRNQGQQVDRYYRLIDKKGLELGDVKFQQIGPFCDGLAKVEVKNPDNQYFKRIGFINVNGEMIIAPIYDVGEDFSEGRAVVGIRNKPNENNELYGDYSFGYVNQLGDEVISLQYSYAGKFMNGRAVVSYGDQKGVEVIHFNPEDNSIVNEDFLPKYGVIDTAGNYVLNFDWGLLTPIDSDRYCAQRAGYMGEGVIDEHGNTVLPFNYSNLSYLGDNLFVANDGGGNEAEVQLITMDNKLLFRTTEFAIPAPKYEHGLLHVRTNNMKKSGFVDIYGNWVIKDLYDMVWNFEAIETVSIPR